MKNKSLIIQIETASTVSTITWDTCLKKSLIITNSRSEKYERKIYIYSMYNIDITEYVQIAAI